MFYNYDRMSFQVLLATKCYHENGVWNTPARPYATLSLRIRGVTNFKIGNKFITVKPGDVMFMAAGVDYEAEYSDNEMIIFDLSDCNYPESEGICLNNYKYVSHMFQDVVTQWNKGCSTNIIKASIYTLLAKIEEDSLSNRTDAIIKCSQYIRDNYTRNDLKLSDICEFGNISEASLYRKFVEHYNMSPKQYIINLRLKNAVELLIHRDISIDEIAKSSGFQNAKYFAHVFKECYGLPPSRYRGEYQ